MAGYIFSVSKESWDSFCAKNLAKGFFTPLTIPVTNNDMTSRKRKSINKVLAATFGDFVTMKSGDNIYFLSNRKIYGTGVTKVIGEDCKYDNYLDSSALLPDCQIKPSNYLTTTDTRARWVCFFTPSPYFFKKGADMDDVLRYRPQAFRALRAFEGLSFIKIDDEENRALKEYISLINENAYDDLTENIFSFDTEIHDSFSEIDMTDYLLDISKVFNYYENKDFVISEMLFESLLLQRIITKTIDDIGNWDYLTHQLIASPFKPLKYIDKIDIFGYRFSSHYKDNPKLITKYLIIEVKKDTVNREAIKQTMQYVDWICSEYASGDYSKIEAYVVGRKAARGLEEDIQDICQRSFIKETHPVVPKKWNNIKLLRFLFDEYE